MNEEIKIQKKWLEGLWQRVQEVRNAQGELNKSSATSGLIGFASSVEFILDDAQD